MPKKRSQLVWLLVVLFLFSGKNPLLMAGNQPKAIRGQLDLREWDFDRQGALDLTGEWTFFWKRFVISDGTHNDADTSLNTIPVPSYWHTTPFTSDEDNPGFGYATYKLELLLPEDPVYLHIYVRLAGTAHRLYVVDANGQTKHLGGIGSPGKNGESSLPSILPYEASFFASGKMTLFWEVSNYHHFLSGFRHAPLLGKDRDIITKTKRHAIHATLGAILIISFFNLVIYFFHRRESATLWLGFSGLLCGLLVIFQYGLFFPAFKPFVASKIFFTVGSKLWLMCIAILPAVLAKFLSEALLKDVTESSNHPILLGTKSVIYFSSLLYSLTILLLPVTVFSRLVFLFYIIVAVGAFWGIFVFARSVIRGKDLPILMSMLGFIVNIAATVNDALYTMHFLDSGYYFQFGYVVFISTQAFIIARTNAVFRKKSELFSQTIEKQANDLRSLNEDLEKKVQERTSRLIKAEATSSSLLEQSPDRIIAVDSNYLIRYCNRHLNDEPSIMGKPVFSVIAPSAISSIHAALEKAFQTGTSDMIECDSDISGSTQWYEYRFAGIKEKEETVKEVMIIITNITKRKRAERELEIVQKQLVEKAHKAGMADIATDILHNVGNSLNSLKLSAELALTAINKNQGISGFMEANKLVRETSDLETFLNSDPRAVSLMRYYLMLEDSLTADQEEFRKNLQDIQDVAAEISETVLSQRKLVGKDIFREEVNLIEMIEEALMLQNESIIKKNIRIKKKVNNIPKSPGQKSKLVYVLENIIENAIDAMGETTVDNRILEISLADKNNTVDLRICDTGSGIQKENLTKIFSRGFTTNPTGHGFGLHNCANYIAEMGGKIWAESAGPEKGATFVIQLPIA